MQDGLIDRIYEAGAVPELWPRVLEEIDRLTDALGSILIATRDGDMRYVCSTPEFEEFTLGHYAFEGGQERTRRLLSAGHAGFLRDIDAYSVDELANEPLFRDFMIPRGGGSGVATAIFSPSGDTIIIHAECAHARGPVPPHIVSVLDELRPHFARAALLSARMELQRADTMARAFELVRLPAAMLGHSGRIIASNRLFDRMVPEVFQDRAARLSLANRSADKLFAAAVSRLDQHERTVRSVPVPATETRSPAIVHVVPVRGAAHDIFAMTLAVVIVTPVEPRDVPTAEVIQGLFDLTPAEARIARAIGNGETPTEIAAAGGRTEETVRSQLKSVLSKTGLHRQSQLVGLLRGIASFGGDGSTSR